MCNHTVNTFVHLTVQFYCSNSKHFIVTMFRVFRTLKKFRDLFVKFVSIR